MMQSSKSYPKVKSILLVIAVLLVLVAAPRQSHAVSLYEIQLSQMDFYGLYGPGNIYYGAITDTQWGDFKATVYPDSDPRDYMLNLILAHGTYGPVWVIRNMRLPNSMQLTGPLKIARFFDLGAVGVQPGDIVTTIDYALVLTLDELQEMPDPGIWYTTDVNDDHYNAIGEGDANGTIATPNDIGSPPQADEPNDPNDPNRPSSSKIYTGVRNVEEEPNGCGPGAVERAWWILVDNNEITINDMNTVMGKFRVWSGWNNNNSLTAEGFLRGKAGIGGVWDVVTKYQQRAGRRGGPERTVRFAEGVSLYLGGPPSFAFIKQELDANEVIEITVRDPNDLTRGHVMTVIGYQQDSDGLQIWVQDDPHQGRDDPDGNHVRNSRFVTDSNGNDPRLADIPLSAIYRITSQSPLEEPPEPNIVQTPGDDNEPNTISVTWPGYSAVTEPTERIWRNPSYRVTAGPGWRHDFYWTAGGITHPMYKPVSLTNESETDVVFRWILPNDPSITDWRWQRYPPGSENPSDTAGGNTRRASPWALYSIGELPDIPHRIPTLISSANDVNLYCAVNLELYMTANPLGFVGNEPITPGSTLADFGVVINDGRIDGVEGIYYATCPFVLDPNSETGWAQADANCLVDSDDFELQNGPVGVDEGINHYVASDINRNFYVDFRDYARFAARWLDTGCAEPLWCTGADIDRSSEIDNLDIAIIGDEWLLGF